MKRCFLILIGVLSFVTSSTTFADSWVQGTITDIQIVAAGNSNDKVAVYGNFTPAMGCIYSGFFLQSSDPYFNQSYAMLLLAKATGAIVRFTFSYCDPASGFARGNSYFVLGN